MGAKERLKCGRFIFLERKMGWGGVASTYLRVPAECPYVHINSELIFFLACLYFTFRCHKARSLSDLLAESYAITLGEVGVVRLALLGSYKRVQWNKNITKTFRSASGSEITMLLEARLGKPHITILQEDKLTWGWGGKQTGNDFNYVKLKTHGFNKSDFHLSLVEFYKNSYLGVPWFGWGMAKT